MLFGIVRMSKHRRKACFSIGSVSILGLALVLGGCRATPICVLPSSHSFTISESEVPVRILGVFHEAFGNSALLRAELYIAGERLVFYVFRFRQDGKVQESLITPAGKLEMTYDVSEE